jgi:hypothetical protein
MRYVIHLGQFAKFTLYYIFNMELASTSNDPKPHVSCSLFFIAQRTKNRKLIFCQLAFVIAIGFTTYFFLLKKFFELLIKLKKILIIEIGNFEAFLLK